MPNDDFPQTIEALRAAHAASLARLIEAQDSWLYAKAYGDANGEALAKRKLDDARRNEAAWSAALDNAEQPE